MDACFNRSCDQTLQQGLVAEVSPDCPTSRRTLVEEVGDFCLVLIPHSNLSFISQEGFLLRVVHQGVEKCVLQPKHNMGKVKVGANKESLTY